MSKENITENEIEDSLRVCNEIKGYLEEEEFLKDSIMNTIDKDTVEEAVELAESVISTSETADTTEELVISEDEIVETEETEKVEAEEDAEEVVEETTDNAQESEEDKVEEESAQENADVVEETVEEEEKLHEMDYSDKEEDMAEPEVVIPTTTDFEADPEKKITFKDKFPLLYRFSSLLICVAIALVLSIIITKFFAYHTSVEGISMENTISNGDQLIVEKTSYYFNNPSRYDVVVFPYNSDSNYIKRIIGLPGETVLIRGGVIYIDGAPLKEDYGKQAISDPGLAAQEILLGADEYFVLGDNRNASVDSRATSVGTVKGSEIKGKAWFRFYPFDQMGVIE